MFKKSAPFYDALYHFMNYETAASALHALIQRVRPSARTVLDVACGTGKHLETLRAHYRVEGLDISEDMLSIARARCPEVPFHQADMTDFDLHRTFDVVTCLFSSVAYVKTVENLYRAVARMAAHVGESGMLVIEPWIAPDRYWLGRLTANFVDKPDLKIAWMYLSELGDNTSIFDIRFLIGTPDGITSFTERHEMGLFTDAEYEQAFERVGFRVSKDPKGFFGRGLYLGLKDSA